MTQTWVKFLNWLQEMAEAENESRRPLNLCLAPCFWVSLSLSLLFSLFLGVCLKEEQDGTSHFSPALLSLRTGATGTFFGTVRVASREPSSTDAGGLRGRLRGPRRSVPGEDGWLLYEASDLGPSQFNLRCTAQKGRLTIVSEQKVRKHGETQ